MLVKVEGGMFVKDTKTNAVLTVNKSAIEQNEARKRLSKAINSKNEDVHDLKSKVESLNNDVTEIKQLLQQLLNKEK